jgi:hypothetical protein
MTKTPSVAYDRRRVEIKIVHQYRTPQMANVVTGMIDMRDKVIV